MAAPNVVPLPNSSPSGLYRDAIPVHSMLRRMPERVTEGLNLTVVANRLSSLRSSGGNADVWLASAISWPHPDNLTNARRFLAAIEDHDVVTTLLGGPKNPAMGPW